jgi:protein phosphatase
MQAGDIAAQIAIDTLAENTDTLIDQLSKTFHQACEYTADVFQTANDRIAAWARQHATPGAVGTTLVTLIIAESQFLVINVGDSRCYRIDRDSVQQITRDHTVAESLIQQGALSPAVYDSSPLRNQLLRSVGPTPIAQPDFFPLSGYGTADSDATFLLCSDGFYTKLREPDFVKLHDHSSDLESILQGLAAEALQRGSSDNISAAAIRFELPVLR